MLIDTHAHIHFDDYATDIDGVFDRARQAEVGAIITVGTDEVDSQAAVSFVRDHHPADIKLFATVGLHPHEASRGEAAIKKIRQLAQVERQHIVAIGECGLDYYRNLSTPAEQAVALREQIELAHELRLPLVFHVRDAWGEFWQILDDYHQVRGVIHSFTGGPREVASAHARGLSVALNGIMTFTKLDSQLEAAGLVDDKALLLETDCPYLTPAPHRGKRNEPANVRLVAEFLAKLRRTDSATIAAMTTHNAQTLFGIAS